MSNIRVSYAEIEEAAAQLGREKEEISSRLGLAEQKMQSLVSSGFVTEHASGKFAGAFSEYVIGAKTVIAKMSEIQLFLSQTASALREMDLQIAARIN